MKKLFSFIAYAIGIVTMFIPGLHELCIIKDGYIYFYHGKFIYSSAPLFVENGELMIQYWGWAGYQYHQIGILFIVIQLSIICVLIRLLVRIVRKLIQRFSKSRVE